MRISLSLLLQVVFVWLPVSGKDIIVHQIKRQMLVLPKVNREVWTLKDTTQIGPLYL